MGSLLCCCPKKRQSDLNTLKQPIINTEDNKENINNKDTSLTVNETNSNIISENEKNNEPKPIVKENTTYSKYGLNLNEDIDDDELLLKEDSPLICDYEKGVITFTRNGFIKLFDTLWVLDNYKSVYNKDDLLIELRYEGTPMNKEFYLIKMIHKIKKSDLKYNKDKDSIMDYCYDLTLRPIWDEALKLIEKYEGNDTNYIVCTWGKSPVFFVSERETIEKRFRFAKGNSVYIMSTSIPLDIYEKKDGVVRFIDFLNLFKVSDEGDYIYFSSLNQVDFKMAIPQMLINMTLPSTSKSWFNNIIKFTNSIKYDRKNKKYERFLDNDDDD
jgi:hypothetical protein